jgi:biofilm PGA synthesis N-glycosyltransferase PgaC
MQIPEIIFWFSIAALFVFYSGYYALCSFIVRRRKFDVNKDKRFRPKITFIIPTWNEEDTIKGKLENTLALDYPKKKIEIIVFDSGSNDATRNIVSKFKSVRLISERRRCGKASALNKAFRKAHGEIVVVSDSDCRLKRDVLVKSMPYFNDPSVGAVTGREIIINADENAATKTEKSYRGLFYLIRGAESIMRSTYVFDGPFEAFRRKLLGNIDSNCVADDSEIAMNINRKGYRAISVPEATYYEYAPPKISDRTKQKSRRAEGLTQSMLSHISYFFMNRKYGIFGLLIFPAGVFMHIISPFLLVAAIATLIFIPLPFLIAVLALFAIVMAVPKTRYSMVSFLHSQYSSLLGVIKHAISKPNYSWEKISSTRRY